MITKQLFRNKQKGKIGGVCAGLGEYFEVDITLIRALFLVALLGFGSGFLMYVILWIVLPERSQTFQQNNSNETFESKESSGGASRGSYGDFSTGSEGFGGFGSAFPKETKLKKENVIGALVLITLGVIFLADEFIPWISFQKLWPLILIAIGIGMLYTNTKKNQN
jgi:phage shock protein PspC (stress-responsive transcriptional regulator)